ncbi:2-polyprenyl-6-methoxyphenol hydroxylase-like FAD-dependent oxidoreductase [Kitasatospora sp. MAA4]|uniref:FAD-dependent monooxygenase n=1 Tax=Kitasatospora sp. MAA4 TaxID=3035093 RepID=UPI0024756D85|nr:FAD-dependent monooxygenase [Kitasatospora sp. MAA4]MDH6134256.1 2-polyprenyl-6-methoxyphenol hydroxylase-like FAD-dependent oxidoreductase [Kitasatospora sp. MAA4]
MTHAEDPDRPAQQVVPVLIVGAGPVGLAAACALHRRGVPARIVEAAAEPNRGSRAVQLHPPTLQIFRELGVLDEAEKLGLKVRATNYHLASGRRLRVELGSENEPLMLPQEQTSRLLEEALERLGGRVERSVRVVDVSESDGRVSVKVESPEGTELITADWLIAADGVRSHVRSRLGIEFVGEQVPAHFLLAEGRISGDFEPEAVHYFLGHTGSIVFAAMPQGRVRISGAVPPGYPLTAEGVQQLLDERGPGHLRILELDTVNEFSSQERIAATLRSGRCFLIGDAAHTHSPLGGQGLNLGLQDAHNLSWKLAGVVNGTLRPAILDSYEPERLQAAAQIVRTTHRFLRVFTLGPAAARLRNSAWSALEATGVLRRWFVPLLAGWRVRYPDVLSEPQVARRSAQGLPAPGTRPPRRLAEALAAAEFRLLTLGPANHGVVQRGRDLGVLHSDLLTHRHIQQPGVGFVLVRPDGYVAASGTTPAEFEQAQRLLARITA